MSAVTISITIIMEVSKKEGKAWDPMGIKLVSVWYELCLALSEHPPPVRKYYTVHRKKD